MSVDSESATKSHPVAPPARRLKRKLSPFLCKEMLYEYVTDRLDAARRADIEEYLPGDKSSLDALESVRLGLEYANRLADAELSQELLERIGGAESFALRVRRLANWKYWPESARWSLSALAASLLVAGAVAFVPWQKIMVAGKDKPTAVILADIPMPNSSEGAVPATPTELDAFEDEVGRSALESAGKGHDEKAPPAPVAAVKSQSTPPPPQPVATPGKIAAKAQSAASPANAPAPPSAAAPVPAAAPVTSAESTTAASATPEAKPKGFVYRAFMKLANVQDATPDVVRVVQELGGEKAGEVPLGWQRGSGSYFHFTLPESSEQALLDALRTYGPVRISKDPHPRVMPRGQVRFILWVEPE